MACPDLPQTFGCLDGDSARIDLCLGNFLAAETARTKLHLRLTPIIHQSSLGQLIIMMQTPVGLAKIIR
jgi:hypothetical protein